MIKGEWDLNINYQRGDIVTILNNFISPISIRYYICAIPHMSNELVYPKFATN
jgi:hypothetical protein